MEINLNKHIRSVCAVAVISAASIASSSVANAASIAFAEGDTVQGLNTNFTLNLTAYDLEPVTNGGDLVLTYDQSILSVVTTGPFAAYWNLDPYAGVTNNPATGLASIDIYAYSLFAASNATPVQDIFSIEFTTVGTGVASLGLSFGIDAWTYNQDAVDANGDPIYVLNADGTVKTDTRGRPIQAVETIQYCVDVSCGLTPLANAAITPLALGQSTVTVVPVPAAVWLFVSGIAGLVGVSRRKPS